MSSRPVVAAALLVLLAGCTQQTTGDPSASGGTPTVGSGQSTDKPTTTTTEDGGGVADLKPCGILQSGDLQALQLTGGEEKEVSGVPVCRYRHDGASLNESFTVSVELFDGIGLDEINADGVERLPNIGSHEAASFVDPGGGCGVSIGVTSSSRIDNTATGGDNQQLACQLATQLATAVERRLP